MQATEFAAYLLTIPNLLIVSAVWVVISGLKKALPKLAAHPTVARLMPLIPILACSLCVWIPGAIEGEPTIATRLFLGIVLGAMVGHAHKILKQTALGHDSNIK